jgi:integrase
MRREWVNWDVGYIRVPESQPCNCYVCRKPRYRLDRKTGERKLVKPAGVWKVKVPEAARVIPLTPEVRSVLERYFGRFDSIMENVRSQPVAWRIVRGVAERAGLSKRIFPHALRGTFASILAGKGFDSFAIQAALGWKSIKTADEYVRISPDRLLRKFKEKW